MRRREFITLLGGAAAAWPLAARAQQGERLRRVGVLVPVAADDPNTKTNLTAFRQELERLGWLEQRNLHIDYRFAAGRSDRICASSARADRIATRSDPGAGDRGSRHIAAGIAHDPDRVHDNVSDPIGAGFVASLAQPGGNLTGVLLYEAGIVGKWLALLKEIAPRLRRAALVGNPKTTPFGYFQRAAAAAAPPLAFELVPTPIENATADVERVIESFACFAERRPGCVAGSDHGRPARRHHRPCRPASSAGGLPVSLLCG